MDSRYEEMFKKTAEVYKETLGDIDKEIAEKRAALEITTRELEELEGFRVRLVRGTEAVFAVNGTAAVVQPVVELGTSSVPRQRRVRARNKPGRKAGALAKDRKSKVFDKLAKTFTIDDVRRHRLPPVTVAQWGRAKLIRKVSAGIYKKLAA